MMPSLFLSHGSPMIALEPSPAADFLVRLAPVIERVHGRPRAVVIVSPHTSTRVPYVLSAPRHEAIHDFGGFPQALFDLRYNPPGDPALAADVAQRLNAAGIATQLAEAAGIDHGIWTLLRRMWPAADVPVVPLSLVPNWRPAQQWAIGAALADLAQDDVLIIGSGSFTHNLGRFFGARGETRTAIEPDVVAFQQWVAERAAARDWPALLDYRVQAPGAALQHPTDEHWLPFYVAAGAGGEATQPQRLHDSVDLGLLAMDGYAFGPAASALAEALKKDSVPA
ncbi:MAG: class III extradiol ring-cleavage dioxygenase [Burkholderiales bacterium]